MLVGVLLSAVAAAMGTGATTPLIRVSLPALPLAGTVSFLVTERRRTAIAQPPLDA